MKKQSKALSLFTILLLIIFSMIACIETKQLSQGLLADFTIPYDLYHPDRIINLPAQLVEVSGVAFYNEDQLLTCEDETGKVYAIDIQSGDILDYFDFGKKGDYEDLALAPNKEGNENHIYVLRSDTGNLYRINNMGEKNQKDKIFKTFLKERHNAEGLCYLPKEDILLLACKDKGDKNSSLKTEYLNYIFAFNMKNKKIIPEPYLSINAIKINEIIAPLHLKEYPFQPSAIAQAPDRDELYILSSVNKALLIMSTQGEILNYLMLPETEYPQPEGICFAPDGRMFISNEGKTGPATILIFSPK